MVGQRIGIIVAVSDYSEQPKLPGCEFDAQLVQGILQKTESFTDIFYSLNQSSDAVKAELSNFIETHKGEEVDEVFFYYSGHGQYLDNEFYYILSDFNDRKRKQTSLENSELDDLIRLLSPAVTIKIVDACQSGAPYIKESNAFERYLNDSSKAIKDRGTLNKCYFMFSSQIEQSSYQTEKISDFTEAFARAIVSRQASVIRYKDIMDFIADEFQTKTQQRPVFVTQASYTEKFCVISDEMREWINEFLEGDMSPTGDSNTLIETVLNDAMEHCSMEEIASVIANIRVKIEGYNWRNEIAELFDVETQFLNDYSNIPRIQAVAEWIQTYEDGEYFVTLNVDTDWLGDEIVTGFDVSFELPYKAVEIVAKGRYQNLPWFYGAIVFVFSKKRIRFFLHRTQYLEQNWDEHVLQEDGLWRTVSCKMKSIDGTSGVADAVDGLLAIFEEYVVDVLDGKFMKSDTVS